MYIYTYIRDRKVTRTRQLPYGAVGFKPSTNINESIYDFERRRGEKREKEREDAKEERSGITPHNALVPGEESPCEYHR
jgi:hypothetical protein